tara:strand:+ start:3163 stop:3810 length:648 start_codon:yes stop_codon:yes gene_type:complete
MSVLNRMGFRSWAEESEMLALLDLPLEVCVRDAVPLDMRFLIVSLGGISLFSAERGWVCDSLVNLQIVLASGAVVNANATSNSNLFAALKGGGNNFGVVTRFDFETFTQGPIWGGTVTYNSSSDVDRRLLTAFAHYKQPESFDEYTGMWLSFARNLSNAQQQSAFSILFHSKPDLAPGALQPFMDLQPQLKNAVAVNFPSTITRSISEVAARPDT